MAQTGTYVFGATSLYGAKRPEQTSPENPDKDASTNQDVDLIHDDDAVLEVVEAAEKSKADTVEIAESISENLTDRVDDIDINEVEASATEDLANESAVVEQSGIAVQVVEVELTPEEKKAKRAAEREAKRKAREEAKAAK